MSGALDPIQEDLPIDLPSQAGASPGPGAEPDHPAWHKPATPPGPALSEQVWSWAKRLPWQRWRAGAAPIIEGGVRQLGNVVRISATQAGTAARAAVTRGAPYTVKLAQATATTGLFPAVLLWIARVVHLLGLPAVVLRSAVQVLLVHRAGLAIDEVVFFRLDDPAAYTVYETPPRLGLAAAIVFIPTVLSMVLAVICLGPALTPRAVLHLPTTWLTWVQIWLGLGFAAHALPTYEEAGPLAEQAGVGISRADPAAVALIAPAYLTAWVTRFGGLLPALLGSLLGLWLANAVLRI